MLTVPFLSAAFVNRAGESTTIKNAICIHEEDAGILFKHTDFRDDSVIVTRGRKLIISHIFTAANYEYCVYWIFHQDGTVQLEIKLTGILNTYAMNPGEDTKGWGTEVYPGVNAHNHQHLFCLRIDPNIDGPNNTVFQVDATQGAGEVGSKENFYGNAFYAKRTKYTTVKEAVSDYDGVTSRTWDMCNPNKLNPHSHKPVSYKLVSREVPKLLPKEGSLVWKRAGFARHAIHVTKCKYTLHISLFYASPLTPHRRRRPNPPRRAPRSPNIRGSFTRHPRMDRERRCLNRQHRHRPLAHVRHHAFPRP